MMSAASQAASGACCNRHKVAQDECAAIWAGVGKISLLMAFICQHRKRRVAPATYLVFPASGGFHTADGLPHPVAAVPADRALTPRSGGYRLPAIVTTPRSGGFHTGAMAPATPVAAVSTADSNHAP